MGGEAAEMETGAQRKGRGRERSEIQRRKGMRRAKETDTRHTDWDTQTRLTAAAGRAETCRQTHRYTHTRIWTDTLVYRYIHLWHNT